jgi:hypothetical protein
MPNDTNNRARFLNAALRPVEGQAPNIYPPITQISADLDMRRADKEKESAEICVIGG